MGHSFFACGCVKSYSHYGNNMVILYKVGNQSLSSPSHTTLRHVPRRSSILPQRHLFTLFIMAKNPGKILKVPQQKNEQRKCGTFTQWSIIQLLKDNIVKVAGKWIELEN